ncbi:hypothetical protein GGI07_002993 [Coemansia sp. Benny D115]|nr:hypothetical protein GGI07_002993 [Coemansia sp. Benny D115]
MSQVPTHRNILPNRLLGSSPQNRCTENESAIRKRERNKLAARRKRERKKQRMTALEEREKSLKQRKMALQMELLIFQTANKPTAIDDETALAVQNASRLAAEESIDVLGSDLWRIAPDRRPSPAIDSLRMLQQPSTEYGHYQNTDLDSTGTAGSGGFAGGVDTCSDALFDLHCSVVAAYSQTQATFDAVNTLKQDLADLVSCLESQGIIIESPAATPRNYSQNIHSDDDDDDDNY